MGLTDPEDLIPGIIIAVMVLALLGGLATYVPVINTIPVLNVVTSTLNQAFLFIANLLTPFIPLQGVLIAVLLEILVIIISIIIIIKVR